MPLPDPKLPPSLKPPAGISPTMLAHALQAAKHFVTLPHDDFDPSKTRWICNALSRSASPMWCRQADVPLHRLTVEEERDVGRYILSCIHPHATIYDWLRANDAAFTSLRPMDARECYAQTVRHAWLDHTITFLKELS